MTPAVAESAIAPRGAAAIDRGVLPTTEVIARVHRIQEVMKVLMKEGTHFGTIPGTPKPTLYKPGAEMLLMTFRIAASPCQIEDLSNPDEVRYRVMVRGTNQVSGEIVGEMVGECSSSEEKYKWRKPVCDEEWEETDQAHRREKWARGSGSNPAYKTKQVRTSPPDVANTILKMATKRALIALTLVSLGASDIFAQDLEDLAEELRESVTEGEAPKSEARQPQRRSANGPAAVKSSATTLPANCLVVVGFVQKVWPGEGNKPTAIVLKGNDRKYTTFKEEIGKEAKAFEGTDHQVKLGYTETIKGSNTYYNAVGIILHEEPKAAETPAPAATSPATGLPLDREPGSEG